MCALNKMRALIFSKTLSRIFFILRRIHGDDLIIVHRCSCKNSSHSHFKKGWMFPKDFLKILPISNFMKILTVKAELYHADEETD